MVKKMCVAFVGLFLLMLFSSFSSALEIVDLGTDLGNEKAYFEEFGDYGKIVVTDLYDEDLAEYILLESKNSILNSYATGEVVLYQSGKLFDGVLFQNIRGQEISLKDVDVKYFTIEEEEVDTSGSNWTCNGERVSNKTYQFNLLFDRIYYNETYILENNLSNTTNPIIVYPELYNEIVYNSIYDNETQCFPVESSYIQYIYGDEFDYEYSNLPTGTYGWSIVAEKGEINQMVDWVISAKQKLFTEWYWWNDIWGRKQTLTMDLGGYVGEDVWVEVNIPEDGDYNNLDWSDSRFILDDEEIEYTEAQVFTNYARFNLHIKNVPSSTVAIEHYYDSDTSVSTATEYDGSVIIPTTSISGGESVSNIEAFVSTENNSRFNSNSFTLSCEAISSFGVNRITLYIDGSQQSLKEFYSSNDASADFTVSGIEDGEHTFYCIAKDSQGESTTQTYSFELDKTSPTVTIT